MLIDLNADLGEGAGTDADLMPLITSANVCCGAHAGGPELIWETVQLAHESGVTVGAHPGFADREHFGRRELTVNAVEVFVLCLYQLGGMIALSKATGKPVRYLKPHGALYNQAMRDDEIASGLFDAAGEFGELAVVGLPGSEVEKYAARYDSKFVPEGFADRRYRPDGSLVPRGEPDAMIHDPKEAVDQVEWLIGKQQVRTICVHGDTPGAVEFVKAVRGFLLDRGHELRAFA